LRCHLQHWRGSVDMHARLTWVHFVFNLSSSPHSPLPRYFPLPFFLCPGCREPMRPHLGPIVEQVRPLLSDPVPRVRYAASKAIGQMSVDFAARDAREVDVSFQTLFHATIIPSLFESIRISDGHPRVQVCRGSRIAPMAPAATSACPPSPIPSQHVADPFSPLSCSPRPTPSMRSSTSATTLRRT
jgi:hypothetical protein